ncbi:adenylate kinase [Lewinellaceae bacterium SD302]|nr:adenylate kinase [Lewinellaceae bacterium SD302]
MYNLILFGPPGSGKGTQAKIMQEKFGLLQISTGDLFRAELGNQDKGIEPTELGKEARSYMDKGQLVPDSVTIRMLENHVEKNPDVPGYIFDGFPRTEAQAQALDGFLEDRNETVSDLIMLEVDDEEIVTRLLERGKDSGRADDANEEVIRNRIEVYREQTSPVYDYYDAKELARKVDGLGSLEEVAARLHAIIEPSI